MDVFLDTCLLCHSLLWKKSVVCSSCLNFLTNRDLIFRQERELPIFSLLHYVSPIHELVRAWKAPENSGLFEVFGRELAAKISYECLLPVQGVIPMPAKLSGHHDHAYFIAEAVAKYFRAPVANEFLERNESNVHQKEKTLEKRFELKMNLKTDFKNHIGGKKSLWLLVDDVVTSGSTLVAAWNLLGRPNAIGLTLATRPRFDAVSH